MTIEACGQNGQGGVNHCPEMWLGRPVDKLDVINVIDVIRSFFREKRWP